MTAGRLSDQDRETLLTLARAAIGARLKGETLPSPEVAANLRERRGAFVTLTTRADGSLRGCVGFVLGRFPLWETVERAAEAAALDDDRFERVTLAEMPGLVIEISVLSELRPVTLEEVEVGVHGLLIRRSGRSGLLLPQVAVEHEWNPVTFLVETCRKAGLPPDAWRDPTAEVQGFTAEVFREPMP